MAVPAARNQSRSRRRDSGALAHGDCRARSGRRRSRNRPTGGDEGFRQRAADRRDHPRGLARPHRRRGARSLAGRALRPAHADQEPWLLADGDRGAGARHRRQRHRVHHVQGAGPRSAAGRGPLIPARGRPQPHARRPRHQRLDPRLPLPAPARAIVRQPHRVGHAVHHGRPRHRIRARRGRARGR